MREDDKGGPNIRRVVRNTAIVINIAATFVAAVFGGFFIGYFLDRRLGTTPALTIAASFLGTAGAVYLLLRELTRIVK